MKDCGRLRFRRYGWILGIVVGIWLVEGCNQPFAQGQSLYEANCSRCHGMDGRGFENLYPGILDSPYLSHPETGLACVIVHGSEFIEKGRSESTDIAMPHSKHLSPVEVLNIVNFLSWEFGNGEQLSIAEVVQSLRDCADSEDSFKY